MEPCKTRRGRSGRLVAVLAATVATATTLTMGGIAADVAVAVPAQAPAAISAPASVSVASRATQARKAQAKAKERRAAKRAKKAAARAALAARAAARAALAARAAAKVRTPAKPTGLVSTGRSATTISLTWNTVSGANGYSVYVSSGYVGWTATPAFTHNGLTPNTSYYYQVVATTSVSSVYSAKSNGISVTTLTAAVGVPTMPVGDLPGWRSIFAEDFNADAALGSFPTTYANTMGGYPFPYTDTSRNTGTDNPGFYYPEKTLSAANGVMDAWLHYDPTVVHPSWSPGPGKVGAYLVAAPIPKLPTMTYGRFAVRLKADNIAGYKIAPLLWPDSDNWSEGEINFPEGDLDGSMLSAFNHYVGAPTQQDWFSAGVNASAWHTYETAWSPDKVEFFVDGVSIGSTTTRVSSTPMRWVLQMETQISSTRPPTSAQGHVQIDWVKAYSYNPS